jgi:hypothetical protein
LKDKFDVFQTEEFGKPIFIAQLPNVVIFMYKHLKLKGTGFKNGTGCLGKIVLMGRDVLCMRQHPYTGGGDGNCGSLTMIAMK